MTVSAVSWNPLTGVGSTAVTTVSYAMAGVAGNVGDLVYFVMGIGGTTISAASATGGNVDTTGWQPVVNLSDATTGARTQSFWGRLGTAFTAAAPPSITVTFSAAVVPTSTTCNIGLWRSTYGAACQWVLDPLGHVAQVNASSSTVPFPAVTVSVAGSLVIASAMTQHFTKNSSGTISGYTWLAQDSFSDQSQYALAVPLGAQTPPSTTQVSTLNGSTLSAGGSITATTTFNELSSGPVFADRPLKRARLL